MSLTGQLKEKDSRGTQFFKIYENRTELSNIKARLKSKIKQRKYEFNPPSFVLGYMGTTVDYLIRYVVCGNALELDHTIANEALGCAGPHNYMVLRGLYEIAKNNIDGSDGSEFKVIYGATALAILDTYYRTMMLPGVMDANYKIGRAKDKAEKINEVFRQYYDDVIGGKQYELEINEIIVTFINGYNKKDGLLYGAKFSDLGGIPRNSNIVGGADFDCIVNFGKASILTELKTKRGDIQLQHIRQLLGYAMLCDRIKDGYVFDSVGIYHCRTGEYKYLPCDEVFGSVFPSLGDLSKAKTTFLKFLGGRIK